MHDPAHGRFTLADGREVRLTRLHLHRTYEGVLEGTPELASQFIRERLADEVAKGVSMMPLAILDEGQAALPAYRWSAAFFSPRGVRTDYLTELALCWFSDTIPADLHEAIAAALSRVDWDAHAGFYDIDP